MILNYLTQKQALDNWCWCAVASSVSFFFNKNQNGFQQGDIAGKLINSICSNISTTNNNAPDPSCNVAGDLKDSLNFTGNFAWDLERALSFNELLDQINGFFPVCCEINWPVTGLSHFVSIYGYQNNNIIVGDPDFGISTVDYNSFLNYRQGQWIRSIGTQNV